ncbi:hypothetical protein [Helicobacter canis]|nr:hypothetical protein [Helicobacter canis]
MPFSMKSCIIAWFIWLACMQSLYGAKPIWDIQEQLSLRKDEIYTQEFALSGVPKTLKLYWTLYKNYGLVVHLQYDKFPYQFVLYTDYKRKSFTLPLSQGQDIDKTAYLLLSFRDFDEQEKVANLGLFIMLPKKSIN